MLRIEKDLVGFQVHKKVSRLTWVFLSIVEELYDHGVNFSEEELNRIRKVVREESENAKIDLDKFLVDLEKTKIEQK